jgi:rubrerythrin
MNITEKLSAIQAELKAPKNQFNKFGNYKYRSCEDILEGLKPFLKKYKTAVVLKDDIVVINGEIFIKAAATLKDTESDQTEETYAYACLELVRKGMDKSQATGTSSSYARKYALNALFAIDDTKDADTNEMQAQKTAAEAAAKKTTARKAPAAAPARAASTTAKPVQQREKTKEELLASMEETSRDLTQVVCKDCGKPISMAMAEWCKTKFKPGVYYCQVHAAEHKDQMKQSSKRYA